MTTGGGGSLNLNLEMFKNFHVIANSFWSDGGGRYIFGLGPDLVIRGDGTPSITEITTVFRQANLLNFPLTSKSGNGMCVHDHTKMDVFDGSL